MLTFCPGAANCMDGNETARSQMDCIALGSANLLDAATLSHDRVGTTASKQQKIKSIQESPEHQEETLLHIHPSTLENKDTKNQCHF